MHTLFFDIEWDNSVDRNIICLAYELWKNRNCVVAVNSLVRPPTSFNITPSAFAIHGISGESVNALGRDSMEVMKEFVAMVDRADTLVAHGIRHDVRALIKLAMDVDVKFPANKHMACTKLLGTQYCSLPHKTAGLKWPTLQEFFVALFGCKFEGWHTATCDVAACRSCYFRLMDIHHQMTPRMPSIVA